MNSLSMLHAGIVFPSARSLNAFDSSETRVFVIPLGRLKLSTNVIRLLVWSAAPLTVTVKLQELEFADPSVALQDTDVTPIGKMEPEAGVQITVVPAQLSDTVGMKFKMAPFGAVASIV